MNQLAVRYYDEPQRSGCETSGVGCFGRLAIPPELARVASVGGEQSGNAPTPPE